MFKVLSLFAIAFSFVTLSAQAGTGQIGSGSAGKCQANAVAAVKRHIANHLSSADLKVVEIRSQTLTEVSQDEFGRTTETYRIEYGFKKGELAFEDWPVEVSSTIAQGSSLCVIRKVELKF